MNESRPRRVVHEFARISVMSDALAFDGDEDCALPTFDVQRMGLDELAAARQHVLAVSDRCAALLRELKADVDSIEIPSVRSIMKRDQAARVAWLQSQHQAALRLLGELRHEAKSRNVEQRAAPRPDNGRTSRIEGRDRGAEIIIAAMRYRSQRTAKNGAALDGAIQGLIAASPQWRAMFEAIVAEREAAEASEALKTP